MLVFAFTPLKTSFEAAGLRWNVESACRERPPHLPTPDCHGLHRYDSAALKRWSPLRANVKNTPTHISLHHLPPYTHTSSISSLHRWGWDGGGGGSDLLAVTLIRLVMGGGRREDGGMEGGQRLCHQSCLCTGLLGGRGDAAALVWVGGWGGLRYTLTRRRTWNSRNSRVSTLPPAGEEQRDR